MINNPINILLIEDNPGDARLIKEAFAETSKATTYLLTWVDRLSLGMEHLLNEKTDLVLLDLNLPDSTGIETFIKLHDRIEHIPIIVMTGLDDETLATQAVRQGAQDYLVKGAADGHVLARAVRYGVERKRAEESLRASESLRMANERLNYLISSISNVIYTKATKDHSTTFVSKNINKMLGYSPQEFQDHNFWEEHIHPDDADRITAEFPNLYDKDRHSLDYRFLHQDGAYRWIHDELILVRDEQDEPVEIIGSWSDITDRIEMQERLVRQEKLAILGQLAGGVGHELRNPLSSIKNAAYFLNMVIEETVPGTKEMLELLQNEVNRSEQIINGLLDFARSKSPAWLKIDVNEVLKETLEYISIPDNIQVDCEYEGQPSFIFADPTQLGQIFHNIIDNAIQSMAMSDTPETDLLSIQTRRENENWLEVTISDTGIGISKNNMVNIFEPLFTTKAQGIGLGLAIVKTLVEDHGGQISAQSEGVPGKGSVITIKLPLLKEAEHVINE
jgi:PAS domain S-box-containing protein